MAMAVTLSVHILSQYPVVTWGTPEQQRPLAARDARRRGARRVRPDRAARRQRRRARSGRAPSASGRRRADRLPADRHEDLDLQRARGGPLPRLRDARSGGRAEGHHRVPRREGDARASGSGRTSGRWGSGPARPPSCIFDGAEVPVGEPARRGGRGLPDRAVGAGRGPDLDRGRRASGSRGPALEAAAALPRASAGLRRAARRAAGPPVHARRDGPRRGRRPGR